MLQNAVRANPGGTLYLQESWCSPAFSDTGNKIYCRERAFGNYYYIPMNNAVVLREHVTVALFYTN